MDKNTALVERQLTAYNNKDIEAWLNTYSKTAKQYDLQGKCIANGHDEMRERIAIRFLEPDLHACLVNRISMGKFVIDHEVITRNFPEGKGEIEMLSVYEIENDLIVKASFSLGKARVF